MKSSMIVLYFKILEAIEIEPVVIAKLLQYRLIFQRSISSQFYKIQLPPRSRSPRDTGDSTAMECPLLIRCNCEVLFHVVWNDLNERLQNLAASLKYIVTFLAPSVAARNSPPSEKARETMGAEWVRT